MVTYPFLCSRLRIEFQSFSSQFAAIMLDLAYLLDHFDLEGLLFIVELDADPIALRSLTAIHYPARKALIWVQTRYLQNYHVSRTKFSLELTGKATLAYVA